MPGRNPYKRADTFTKAAKAKGYPARSVFKLEEIDRRVRLFKPGQRVLDLGAAPGSWAMFAHEKIGPRGQILAVDLQAMSHFGGPEVVVVQGDALSLDEPALAMFAPYDVVLSDMAPSTSGAKGADQARSLELFEGAVRVAAKLASPGGKFVGKLFMGPDFQAAKSTLAASFAEVRVIRPEATRSVSSEVFLVGLGRRGAA
jgi:23S rRNA (uridine2552-2'-O)-methyltransferase